jgi:flagellin
MSLVINTNVASLNAQRSLGRTQNSLSKSFERLSSGLRINSASDDAAGLGVSEGLKARIRSYSVAERNTTSGLNMAKTAESGLGEISGIVIRMRELAVQSANGDLNSTDREFIDTEFQLLKSEINRLAGSTEFNGIELLAGSSVDVDFQVGVTTTEDDVISVSFGGISTTSLGITGISVDGSDSTNATGAITSLDDALTQISTNRATFGAAANRLQLALNSAQTIRTNLEAANSSISDVDVAEETSILARSQVLLQAGTSVLAQANQAPQLVLQLLG